MASVNSPNASTGGDEIGPAHVAIIMDGNGRWAAERGLSRLEGHRRGMEAVRAAVRTAPDLGVQVLTVYSFSSENWSRPDHEVEGLFALLRIFIQSDLADLHERNVRISVIGSREGVPTDICQLLSQAESLTVANTGLRFVVAFNYGGRDEIVRAIRRTIASTPVGEISQDTIAAHLDTAGIPDPDLIIRTSGEQRLSNFLLWQSAYSEFVFVPQYWPEFDRSVFAQAIEEFRRRRRRYGGLSVGTGA